MNARPPVEGTMPRGFVAFEYDNTLEDYLLAGKELKNPFENNEDNIEKGKQLYQMFCAHCHGKNGDGKGSITPVYGAIPSYADDVMIRRTGENMNDLAAGNIYHAIYYGLNAMGPHNTQINDMERWLITMYVQELQKKLIKIKLTVYVHSNKKHQVNFLRLNGNRISRYCFRIY